MIKELEHKLCDDDLLCAPKVLRKFVYVQIPSKYDIRCLLCGSSNIEWSEFESHIWCYDCNQDVFIPHCYAGIFGGPIPVEISRMLGVCFDRGSCVKGIEKYFEWTNQDLNLNFEHKTNKERFEKIESILTDEITRWEDTWVYDEKLELYKARINKKLFG